jgi:2-polyprenyl-6-methoxyphenol hydroxylase-like FAD-dependent oxidoreductase
VLRAELHRLLSEYATERGARVEVGCEVKSVTDEEQLLLSDGRRVEADWVFGADGRMGSPLRRYVLGENQPRYGGFVNWIGVARAEEDVFDPSVVFDLWGCGQRFGVVPIDGQTAYFAGGALGPLGVASAGPLLPLLKERFAHWPEPVARALAAAEPESLREIYVHDHDPIDVWHKGRVLLLGDAAHAPLPTSGQGACQAIEDAFHVARLLDEGTSLEPEEFFQRFTECRRDKANAIIAAGRGFAKMVFSRDPEFVAKRNQQSRGTDFSETAASMAGLWSRGLPLAW